MPTFAYNDEDASSQESTSHSHWIRNWLYNSLDVFRRKKFARISAKNEERRKEEKEIEDKARSEALMNFQRKKQEHADSFKPKPKKIIVDVPTTNKLDQSKVWLEEYHHPSSTADISIHEMVGSPVGEVSKEKLDTSWDSTLDLSTTFNSTAKSLFSTSMLAGNTETGEKEATPKLSTLDAYAGTRPSFGVTTVTSTPVAKTFSQQFQAPAKQTTQPPPTAFTKPSPAVKSAPLFEQTPILKTSTPAKLVPIPESTFEICVPSPVKPPTPAPVISRPESPVSKSPFNNLVMHYSADLDRKEDNDIAKDRFEKSGDTNLRGAIKRTINEKLSVCSKKHATAAELTPTIVFLASLMGGKVVDSYNGQSKLQVLDEGAVAYTYDTLIKYSLSVVDKDDNLVFVMGSILRGICQKNSTFESVLFGHLFYSSALLAFDDHISTKFVKSILSDPGRKTLAYGKEQSVIKLFFALHLVNEGEESGKSRLTMSNLWKTAAFILNSPPCIFSTLFLVIAFIEICSDKMKTVYPRQWPKLVSTIQNQLMPLLETNLLSSKLSEEADEARYITVLRSRLENL